MSDVVRGAIHHDSRLSPSNATLVCASLLVLTFAVGIPTPAAAQSEANKPTLVSSAAPSYPAEAVRKHTEGWVEVEFTVGVDGKVSAVSVVKAQPTRVFETEAVRAVKQWIFKPAMRDGQAVESHVRQRIDFKF